MSSVPNAFVIDVGTNTATGVIHTMTAVGSAVQPEIFV